MNDGTDVASRTGLGTRAVLWLFGSGAGARAYRWAMLPLRVTIGAMFAASGMQKAFGWFGGRGFQATVDMVANGVGLPLPALFAVLLVFAELVGKDVVE